MDRMTLDRFDPIDSAHGDGSWRGLFAGAGAALRGLAGAFNPFAAAGAFILVAIAGGIWLAGVDTIATWIRFAAVIAGATGAAYLAGKLSNAIAIALAALLLLGLIAAAIIGLWLVLA